MALALPPLAASLMVLKAGNVSSNVWLMHLLSIGVGFLLALTYPLFRLVVTRSGVVLAIIILSMLGLAITLAGHATGPERWLLLGPVRLYMAPLLLPSILAICAVSARTGKQRETLAFVAFLVTGLILAAQPDASQALALLAGATVVYTQFHTGPWRSGAALTGLALLTAWAFSQPDPLQPVPYVETVFSLVLGQSLWAGLAVISCAMAFLAGLSWQAFKGAYWFASVAAYYAVLFACSVAGLTPAPLIGFGAGPILGFGLLLAVSGGLEEISGIAHTAKQPAS